MYERLARLSRLYANKNREILEEKNTLKELVSDISHQTKTPIANIKLYLEMIEEENDAARKQEYLHKMNGQVDKLDFLLQSMVKMSRLETGTIKIQKQKTPVADTLAMAISDVVARAEKKNIAIDVQYDEHLELIHDKKWTAEAIFNIPRQRRQIHGSRRKDSYSRLQTGDLYKDQYCGHRERHRTGTAGGSLHPILPGAGST